MKTSLSQQQTERQELQLNQQQLALVQLLQMPLEQLEQRVRDEMEANEALEKDPDAHDDAWEPSADDATAFGDEQTPSADDPSASGEDGTYGAVDHAFHDVSGQYDEAMQAGASRDELADYASADELPSYLFAERPASVASSGAPYDDSTLAPASERVEAEQSFFDDLCEQISCSDAEEPVRGAAQYIAASLDADGLLRKSLYTLQEEMALYAATEVSDADMQRALQLVQSLEPPGIGAQSVQQCLQLQLEARRREALALGQDTGDVDRALDIVCRAFEAYAEHHFDVVRRRLRLTDEQFDAARRLLSRLDPTPGRSAGEGSRSVVPTARADAFVTVADDGTVRVDLNNGSLPALRVSPSYVESRRALTARRERPLTTEERDTLTYIRARTEAAAYFINLLSRSRKTLLHVLTDIVGAQRDFFLSMDDPMQLHPLSAADVAARVGVNVSTVARCLRNKYVATRHGLYPATFFLSQALTNAAAEGDDVSARQVKDLLRRLIEGEDKRRPLSDEALTQRIAQEGFTVARRTVAKYREALGIAVARLRKEV